MKPMTPSSVLAAVIGAMPMPRTEVTKKIWDYIKKNKLQDAINRRLINADEKLRAVFGGKKQGIDVRDDEARLEPSEVIEATTVPFTREIDPTAGRVPPPAVIFPRAAPQAPPADKRGATR